MAKSRKRRWFLVLGLAIVVAAIVLARGSEPTITAGSYLTIDLDGAYAEAPPDGLLERFIEDRRIFVATLDNLAKARHDDRIAGVVVRIGDFDGGWAQARELRDRLEDVKANGKQVVAYLRGDALSANLEYYVASVADRIYLAPGSASMLNGLSAEFYFLGGLWEKTDISMTVEQMREYKTFGDMVSRRQMTDAHREMADWILDGVNAEFIGTMAAARGKTTVQMQEIVDGCPGTADAFVEAGLADGVLFVDQLAEEIGDDEPVTLVKEDTYSQVSRETVGLVPGAKIAVIHAVGTIVPGKGAGQTVFGVSVGAETLARAFRRAAKNDEVRAIVLRIDSPGGSASASDTVWRSVRHATERKPVVSSLGNVAASGGYYMAVGADSIVAEPASITGSIGVVLVKPNVTGLLTDLGITTESLTRGRYARLFDLTAESTVDDLQLIRDMMEATYQRFLERVATGRGMETAAVDALAGGRVWTGRQALEHGLVDQLGGLSEAVRLAAERAEIADPESVELVYYPESTGFLAELTAWRNNAVAIELPPLLRTNIERLGPHALLQSGIHALSSATPSIR